MKIGDRVKHLRLSKGWTQGELAEKMGYKSKSSIAHIENGRDIPRSMIVALADILNTTPSYLMGWDDNNEYSQIQETPLPEKIKEARKKAGLSQKELAEKLDMNLRTYGSYERGERDVSSTVLLKICKTLNISSDYLLGRNETERSEPESTEQPSTNISDEDIKFALFNGSEGVTDEMFDEVKQFAEMVKMREESRKNKGNE